MNESARRAWIYGAASCLAGFAVMAVELTASRIAAPLVGSSIYTWTAVIGIILLGIALGSMAGGRMADAGEERYPIYAIFLLSALFVCLIPPLAKHSSFVLHSSNSLISLNVLLSAYLFLLPSFVLGAIQPILLKGFARDLSVIGSRYGALSALWSFGSIAGVFLTGFLFISWIGSAETLWIISALLILMGIAFVRPQRKHLLRALGLAALILIVFLISNLAPAQKAGVLLDKDTAYYRARVVDAPIPGFGDSRLLFLDLDAHSIETSDDPSVRYYTELYPIFSDLKKDIRDILVIGAGAYTMPKHFAAYYPQAHVSVSELDPALIDIGRNYFGLDEHPITTDIGDIRLSLKKSDKKYDVIFGDAYNSYISVPWYLLTSEWNREVQAHLTPGGVYALNFIGALTGPGSDFAKSVLAAFEQSFPDAYVFSTGERPDMIQNIVLVGVNGPRPKSAKGLSEAISRTSHRDLAAWILPDSGFSSDGAAPLTDDLAPAERLLSPIMKSFFSNDRRLAEITGGM